MWRVKEDREQQSWSPARYSSDMLSIISTELLNTKCFIMLVKTNVLPEYLPSEICSQSQSEDKELYFRLKG